MNRIPSMLSVITLAAALAACSDAPAPAPLPAAPPAPVAAAAPVADPTIPAVPASPTPTTEASARGTDTTANNPAGMMSKKQESESMPMAGQGNSHSSPSLDPAKK